MVRFGGREGALASALIFREDAFVSYTKLSVVSVKYKLQQFSTTGLRDNCLFYRFI